ncbi:MAG: Altered inheritance of mitochondria protein 6 [Sclerophora amabilis]|nr:MAG: Altered inheritance of mitochondria protein 6 [Sclerophora amabilis]
MDDHGFRPRTEQSTPLRRSGDNSDNIDSPLLSPCLEDDFSSHANSSEDLLQYDLGWRRRKRGFVLKQYLQRIFPMSVRERRPRPDISDDGPAREESNDSKINCRQQSLWRCCGFLAGGCLLLLTFWHLVLAITSLTRLAWAAGVRQIVVEWGKPGKLGEGLSHYPTDFSRDITPIPCHSHNDYWRRVPLFDALSAGCIGVEADVWLSDDELYVGHDTASLTKNRTLSSLYLSPLVEILKKQNPTTEFANTTRRGVFDTAPSQPVILLIDLKTSGRETWPHVVKQLEPLRQRNWLTFFNGTSVVPGPVTVVGTGNTPFDLLTSNTTYRDYFFDAPLADMYEPVPSGAGGQPPSSIPPPEPPPHPLPPRSSDAGQGKTGTTSSSAYNTTNSFYASVSFRASIGWLWRLAITDRQLALIRGQVRGAHRRGLKVRYWDLPSWPASLRRKVWDVLVTEGVDVLNVDDLKDVQKVWR